MADRKGEQKNDYTIKGNRTVRMHVEIEKWLIKKAKPVSSVPAVINQILIEKYQAEKQAA